jgi:hypothetical protein
VVLHFSVLKTDLTTGMKDGDIMRLNMDTVIEEMALAFLSQTYSFLFWV